MRPVPPDSAIAAAVSGRLANDDAESDPADRPVLQNLVRCGYEMNQEIKRIQKDLDSINARLIEALDDGEKLDAGEVRAQVIVRASARIPDPEELRKIIGAYRYADLVRERIIAMPTDRLRELADTIPEIAGQIEERVGRSIKYTRLEPE